LPFHRIAPGVKDGKDNDSSRFDAVEHRVWKAARLHASDFAMLYGKSVRVSRCARDGSIDFGNELPA
jgi:hypothetical protein